MVHSALPRASAAGAIPGCLQPTAELGRRFHPVKSARLDACPAVQLSKLPASDACRGDGLGTVGVNQSAGIDLGDWRCRKTIRQADSLLFFLVRETL